jgi:hypothetical protein
MNEFLRDYKPEEGTPPKPWLKYILSTLAVVIVAGLLYWFLRDRGEVAEVQDFLDALKAKNYAAAYEHWGCTAAKPCRDYSMDRFLEDWGPKSVAAKPENIKLTDKRSCGTSVIQTLDLGGGETVVLIINRKNRTMGFSPWKVCTPHLNVNG